MDIKDLIQPMAHAAADALEQTRCREPIDLHEFGPREIVKLSWLSFWHRHQPFQRRIHKGVGTLRRIGVPIGTISYVSCTRSTPWWVYPVAMGVGGLFHALAAMVVPSLGTSGAGKLTSNDQ